MLLHVLGFDWRLGGCCLVCGCCILLFLISVGGVVWCCVVLVWVGFDFGVGGVVWILWVGWGGFCGCLLF